MSDDSPFAPRTVTCLVHRNQRATHICTDLNCQNNPILCPQCLNDSRWRVQHPHQSAIRTLNEGVEWLSGIIRTHSKSVELIYQRTIGSRECELVRLNIQKGPLLSQQLDNRLENLRIQLELEMELLVKEFQKHVQAERQEFTRKFEQYRQVFSSNMDFVRKECLELINFQTTLKYYNNPNNFTLKLINQTQRRSQEWIQLQKRVLLRVTQMLQNSVFTNNLSNTLNRVNKSNLLVLPVWKSERRQGQIDKQLKNGIRSVMSNWIDIPQIVDLQLNRQTEYQTSNKYISYPVAV